MVLNLSKATSYFNAEEVAIEHLYGLVIDLDTGIVSVTEEIDNDLVYNYTIIEAKYNGVESEIAIGSLNVLDEYNLEELREFYCYYKNKKNEDNNYEEEEDEELEYNRNLDDDDEDEFLVSRGKSRGY